MSVDQRIDTKGNYQMQVLNESLLQFVHGGDAAATRSSGQNAWGESGSSSSSLNAGECKADIGTGAGIGGAVGSSLGSALGPAGTAIGGLVGILVGGAIAASESSACQP